MSLLRKLSLVLALALASTACGGDDDPADEAGEATIAAETVAGDQAGGAADDGGDAAAETTIVVAAPDDSTAGASPGEGDKGAGDDGTAAAGAPDTSTPEPAAITPREIVIVSIDFTTAEVQLRNITDAPVEIDGWFFCNFPNYAPIEGAAAIGPGETVTVTSTVGIPEAGGELGFYRSGDFGNADDIVAYAEWGAGDHGRSAVAVEAGIWDGVPRTPADGQLIVNG